MLMRTLSYLWKISLCALVFYCGTILGGLVASLMGLSVPKMPAGADQMIIGQYMLLTSLILAVGLASLSRNISGRFVTRWLTLSMLIWIAYGVNNILEGAIFTSMSAASLFTVVLFFCASFLCGAAIAWLFPPADKNINFTSAAKMFFIRHPWRSWGWRLLAAWLAFPIIYLAFGRLIAPLVIDFYEQGLFDLSLPGWEQILPLLAVRSLLFLIACLPVMILWKSTHRQMYMILGLNLFLLVGGLNMLQAYWMPTNLRVIHTLEILVDEIVYASVLVVLFVHSNGKNLKSNWRKTQ